jgi:hypothetical protein
MSMKMPSQLGTTKKNIFVVSFAVAKRKRFDMTFRSADRREAPRKVCRERREICTKW